MRTHGAAHAQTASRSTIERTAGKHCMGRKSRPRTNHLQGGWLQWPGGRPREAQLSLAGPRLWWRDFQAQHPFSCMGEPLPPVPAQVLLLYPCKAYFSSLLMILLSIISRFCCSRFVLRQCTTTAVYPGAPFSPYGDQGDKEIRGQVCFQWPNFLPPGPTSERLHHLPVTSPDGGSWMKKEKNRKRKQAWLHQGVVEGNVYCRYEGELSHRQKSLVESKVDMTLSHVGRGGMGRERGRKGNQVQQPGGPKV